MKQTISPFSVHKARQTCYNCLYFYQIIVTKRGRKKKFSLLYGSLAESITIEGGWMIKVVIVDDIETVVEWLITAVNWRSFDCEIVGVAYDGLEGEILIRRVTPDIVITDVSMPIQDGLTMIASIKPEFPALQTTVLTEYKVFEYAQDAVRLGVARFLIKPSKIEDLEEAIGFMVGRVKELSNPAAAYPEEDMHSEDNQFIVRKAIQYMQDHYSEKLTLAEVADKNFVSIWHLSKLINKHTTKGFNDILNSIRIDNAKRLMENPEYRLYEIAEKVGFTDVTYFSKLFRRYTQMSPNQYRNSRK